MKILNWLKNIMGKKTKSIEPLRVTLTVSGTGSLRTFKASAQRKRVVQYGLFDFGDGRTLGWVGSGVPVSHVYAANGVYQARVEIADYHGGKATAYASVTITGYAPPPPPPTDDPVVTDPLPVPPKPPEPAPPIPPAPTPPPVAAFSVSCDGLTCQLDASASTGVGLVYAWNLGTEPSGLAGGKVVPVTYPHAGSRTVKLAVVDDLMRSSEISQTFEVKEPVIEQPPPPAPPSQPPTQPPVVTPPVVVPPALPPIPAEPPATDPPHPPPVVTPPSPPTQPPAPPPPTGNADVVITLDPSRTFQSDIRFGVTQRTMGDGHLVNPNSGAAEFAIQITEAEKQSVYDTYRDLGLTRLRLATQGAWRQPNQTDTPRFDGVFGDAHIELAAALESRGVETVWDSVMSYDPWVNTPQRVADWNMNWIRFWFLWRPDFQYFSIANEPHNQALFTPEFMRDSIKALGKMLRDEGFLTKLVCPDDINPGEAAKRTRVIMADPEARQYIGALCCHLYEVPLTQMSEMRVLADQYGLPLWMTEYSAYSVAPERRGMFWANIMHECLVSYSCSAVDFMSGFFGGWDKAHLVTLNVGADGKTYTGYTLTDPYYVMGQWSKYVRPGAVRIEATSSDPRILVSAFVNPDGKKVVVAVNTASETLTEDLPGAWYVTSTKPLDPVASLPSQGVTTFVEV